MMWFNFFPQFVLLFYYCLNPEQLSWDDDVFLQINNYQLIGIKINDLKSILYAVRWTLCTIFFEKLYRKVWELSLGIQTSWRNWFWNSSSHSEGRIRNRGFWNSSQSEGIGLGTISVKKCFGTPLIQDVGPGIIWNVFRNFSHSENWISYWVYFIYKILELLQSEGRTRNWIYKWSIYSKARIRNWVYVKDIGALLSENVGSGTQCRTLGVPNVP